ncbi:hypothetical protein [Runella aurantiaca]|uniref:Uncharacterized protein n=1 Tax=Runella aurantiaca TaxID=2282308 RepID=A0A369IAI2_9BACT|nr:hypothetical protein [Runella aurantiaca]RDB04543.1 hypothetical protein DVG78_17795 [Runella aurantiaca]
MKQITLSVPDREYTFFIKVIKAFSFVKIEKTKTVKEFVPTPEQVEWVEGLKSALEEVEEHQQGKKQLKNLDELIDEL